MQFIKKSIVGDFEKLIDPGSGREYRRILCGFAWPYSDRPGFVVVLGEDFDQDHEKEFSPRHFRVLKEHEDFDIEELHRACLKFRSEYLFESVLGNRSERCGPLYKIWQQNESESTGIDIKGPYDFENISLNLITQLLKKKYYQSENSTLWRQCASGISYYLDGGWN